MTEFTILRTLASMPSRIFSRDQMIDRLRGPGFALTDRTVDSHVRNLRRKFAEAGGSDLVETRAGIGYRLGACSGTASPRMIARFKALGRPALAGAAAAHASARHLAVRAPRCPAWARSTLQGL